MKHVKKPQTKRLRNFTKEVERGDVTVEQAIAEIKEEILDEVRAVAGGYKQSIFDLVEKGKELRALEEMSAEKSPPTKKSTKGSEKSDSTGIKPLESVDEIGEDDF